MLAWENELGAPLVYTVHHARDERLLPSYCAHPTVRFVAISHRQAALLPELRCEVVHHGLDGDGPAGRGDGGFVLFLGRLSYCKGPDLAIRAAEAAGLEIVVAGALHEESENPPGWRQQLDPWIHRSGVHAIGPVGGARKHDLLARARAVLAPIRWEEPFGLVLIEAMLRGTPVVATRRGSAPEIVDCGVTGFLVDDERELPAALLRATSLDRDACMRRARARFGARRMVQGYLRIYEAAIATSFTASDAGLEERNDAA
jgi:glycosyltransferase involved in cell wall biosynthesis